jgi:hypothetical protein
MMMARIILTREMTLMKVRKIKKFTRKKVNCKKEGRCNAAGSVQKFMDSGTRKLSLFQK